MKTELTDEQSKPGTDLKFRHFGNSILPCEFAATATIKTELAEDIAEVVTGHTDAEDLAEFGRDLIDHITDMAAVS